MAIAGRMEISQIHSVTLRKVKPRSVSELEDTWFTTTFCSGGINPSDPWNYRDNKPHAVMVFFRDVVAELINKKLIKGKEKKWDRNY